MWGSPTPTARAVGVLVVLLLGSAAHPALLARGGGLAQDSPPATTPATSQVDIRDLIGRLFGRNDDTEPDIPQGDTGERRFIVFPTFGGNPAIGFSAGVLANLTDYLGDPATTTLSSMLVSAAFTTERQVLLVSRSDFSLPNDSLHLLGDWRFYRFSERTHGLGSDRPNTPSADVNYDWLRLHQTVYRPLWFGVEAGVGYHLDVHSNIRLAEEQEAMQLPVSQVIDSDTTTSSGLSLNLVLDTRDSPLNPDQGLLARASYTFYRTGLGGDSDWDSLQLEGRAFQRLPGSRRQTVGVWAIGWLTRAGDPPYFDLPSVGWDTYGRTGRSYRAGRFRGRSWVYSEIEYRTDVTRNGLIGMVGFLNASTMSDFDTRDFQRWRPGGGFGARFKLDKDRRSNIGVDLAWGQEGSVGLYLALNEAF